VLFVLMGMGHWQETRNAGWLAASIVVALFTVVGGIGSLFKRGK
jgi:hypothetical protein